MRGKQHEETPDYLPLVELLEQERRTRQAGRLAVIGALGLLLAAGVAVAAIVRVI